MMQAAPGTAAPRALGARVLRREDARLITGGGRYVSDVAVPGLLEAAFVRSPRAHAVIEAVHPDAARAAPGVVAVLLAEDLDGVARPLRAKNATPGYSECDTPVLATSASSRLGLIRTSCIQCAIFYLMKKLPAHSISPPVRLTKPPTTATGARCIGTW